MSYLKLYTNPEIKGWLKQCIGDDTQKYCLYYKADIYNKKHSSSEKESKGKAL